MDREIKAEADYIVNDFTRMCLIRKETIEDAMELIKKTYKHVDGKLEVIIRRKIEWIAA